MTPDQLQEAMVAVRPFYKGSLEVRVPPSSVPTFEAPEVAAVLDELGGHVVADPDVEDGTVYVTGQEGSFI